MTTQVDESKFGLDVNYTKEGDKHTVVVQFTDYLYNEMIKSFGKEKFAEMFGNALLDSIPSAE